MSKCSLKSSLQASTAPFASGFFGSMYAQIHIVLNGMITTIYSQTTPVQDVATLEYGDNLSSSFSSESSRREDR